MSPTAAQPDPAPPGKKRTWWHPLLTALLRWQLGNHYKVEEEVNVGTKPLQIDVLLLLLQAGDLPEEVQRVLAGLAEHLNEYTLVEFKSPSDTLRAGDLQTFLAYALLYRAQNLPLLAPSRFTMLVVAPRLTKPYRDELAVCGGTAEQEEPGVWRLRGGPILHELLVLETEVLMGVEHPLLTALSPQVLTDPMGVSRLLSAAGYDQLIHYVTQQIQQFRLRGEVFAMQHLGTDTEMDKIRREFLKSITLEEHLAGATAEDILKLIPPEKLLGALTPEELLSGVSPKQREQLRLLLLQEGEAAKPRKPKRGKKS